MLVEYELKLDVIGGTVETMPDSILEEIVKSIKEGRKQGMVALPT